VLGREEGPPPPVDLAHEKRVGDFVRGLIREGAVTAAHDLSDGGLAVALAEMAMASGIGAAIERPPGHDPVAAFFGEDQGRYLLTTPESGEEALLARAGQVRVSMLRIGRTGGDRLRLGDMRPLPVPDLRERHESWFPRFMGDTRRADDGDPLPDD
jgi:phosphoribosylformylglycinamidine synthase